MLVLLLILVCATILWGLTQQSKLKEAKKKLEEYSRLYKPAMDVDTHVRLAENRVQKLRAQEASMKSEISSAESSLVRINEELLLASDASFLAEIGYYEPVYDFQDIPSYEVELQKIRNAQKAMLREDGTGGNRSASAAFITNQLTYNNSLSEGRTAQKRIMKLMLRAFNGESDSFIARVNYRNIEAMEKRISNAFDAINSITEKYYYCVLNNLYLDIRIQELQLVYEWEEAKQREKEEQARIREQMREEEKAAREAQKAEEQAEREELKFQELLRSAQAKVDAASESDKAKLTAQIAELQKRIAEIEEKKRAISQAMLTKTGHVYIISNVGSFGDNVYKIGMTRRLEPMDRVKELGDASVPFPFDVHAMIRTSDAPGLENALHKHFEMRRLNLENQRKEFFRVSIDEIRDELDRLKAELGIDSDLRLTLLADAKEYRISEAKRKHLDSNQPKN